MDGDALDRVSSGCFFIEVIYSLFYVETKTKNVQRHPSSRLSCFSSEWCNHVQRKRYFPDKRKKQLP